VNAVLARRAVAHWRKSQPDRETGPRALPFITWRVEMTEMHCTRADRHTAFQRAHTDPVVATIDTKARRLLHAVIAPQRGA
jgi:hypothetical protein